MREPVRDPGRLEHMLQAIQRINTFVDGRSKDDIQKDGILYFAVVKNVEIIGEAAYMLTQEFKDAHPDTPWKIIIGMRHFLVHGYYEVDPETETSPVGRSSGPSQEGGRLNCEPAPCLFSPDMQRCYSQLLSVNSPRR